MYSIYKIKNNINDKVYIGSTKDFEKRKSRHLNELKNNKHHSIYFQRFYNKHIDKIELDFEILLTNLSKEEVTIKEEELIHQYYENSFNVSKCSTGGDLISYHPKKDEIVNKIKNTLKYKHKNNLIKMPIMKGEDNHNYKSGEYIKVISTCPNCGSQKETLNKYKDHLCKACFASTRTGEKNSFYGKSFSEESKKKLSDSIKQYYQENDSISSKKVYAYGVLYNSMKDAAKALNISGGTMTTRVNSNNWKYRSFYFKGNPKKIEDLKISKTDYSCTVNGSSYETVLIAAKVLNIAESTFINRCESEKQEFNNYEFKCPTSIESIYQI